MNFNWNKTYEKQPESQNTFCRFETMVYGANIALYLYVTPCLSKYGGKRIIHTSVYIDDLTSSILEKSFYEINDDVLKLCKSLFNSTEDIAETSFNEYYCVEEIPTFIPVSFGDYTYTA